MATWSAFPFEKKIRSNHYFPSEKQTNQQNIYKNFSRAGLFKREEGCLQFGFVEIDPCFWRRIALHCHRIFHCILTILLLSSSIKQFSLSFGHTLIHLGQGINALYQVLSKLHLFHYYLPLKQVMTLRFIEQSPPLANALCQSLVK